MSKIFTIVGARPNFIKVDPLLNQTIVHTGQHYDFKMSEVFFKGLNLPKPKYNLATTDVGQMLDKLLALLKKEKPSLVVVIGDTNSAMIGAMAAAMQAIPVAHVESGLRAHDLRMPEELNRIIIDKVAKVKFCPNQSAAMNLLKEGISEDVHIVGDPLFDAMGRFTPFKRSKNYRQYILLTTHRNFNVDSKEPLQNILEAMGECGEQVIFPIHPRTRKAIKALKLKIPKNIKWTQPVGYEQMLKLISNAKKVVTDSGGVQREAFWMSVPVIILRDGTEWEEIINKGGGVLVGTDKAKIVDAIKNFKGKITVPPQPDANGRIRNILYKYV